MVARVNHPGDWIVFGHAKIFRSGRRRTREAGSMYGALDLLFKAAGELAQIAADGFFGVGLGEQFRQFRIAGKSASNGLKVLLRRDSQGSVPDD